MTEVNSMYHAQTRSDVLKSQIEKLEGLAHHTVVNPTFEQFDAETEDLLINIYGANHRYVEAYKYATVGEAEVPRPLLLGHLLSSVTPRDTSAGRPSESLGPVADTPAHCVGAAYCTDNASVQ